MKYFYTRAFCSDCRLHFEYGLADASSTEHTAVLCPRCNQPAKYRPFQPCDLARYERIEAQYERLARSAAADRGSKRSRGQRRSFDEEDEDIWFDRKRRKRPR